MPSLGPCSLEVAELEAAAATYDVVDPARAEAARAGARALGKVLAEAH